jgi:choline dehydrogenase
MGNRGWSYAECLPYFQKSEGWRGAADEIHGKDGPLATSRHGIVHPIAEAFVKAGVEAGYPHNKDFNSGDQLGFGPCDSTIGEGVRSSTARAFLEPARRRQNLTVVSGAMATRILIEKGRATGVEVARGRDVSTVRAEREVILCGGVINSPQLLQLSGVGPGEPLRRLGIKVLHELEGVGQNLQDHPVATVKQTIRQPISFAAKVRPWRAAASVARYMLFKSGPTAHHGIEALGFVKTRPDLVAPDLQYHLLLLIYDDHGRAISDRHGFMPFFNISRPESRGSVMIRSTDPMQAPAIRANYFSARRDLETMREGLKITREIIAQKAFDPYRAEELAPGPAVRTDAEIEAWLRQSAQSVYHPVGTCRMGSDPLAVVDDRLRVRGLDGLRVVDASVMPTITSGNTNAPTIMIAERAADFILGREMKPAA